MTNDEKRAKALQYLGSRHVLHPEYVRGTVNHAAEQTDVAKTLRRVRKQQADALKREQEAFSRIINVRQIGSKR